MCYKVTCQTCGKASWGGCGQHIDSVSAPTATLLSRSTLAVLESAKSLTRFSRHPSLQALKGVAMEDRCKCKPCTQQEYVSK
jgi:hypothetical protein